MPDPSDTTHAVVDRVVDGTAVVLVGDDETEVALDVDRLPEGAGEGAWLSVRVDGDRLDIIGADPDATARAQARAEAQRERLRRRSRRFRH